MDRDFLHPRGKSFTDLLNVSNKIKEEAIARMSTDRYKMSSSTAKFNYFRKEYKRERKVKQEHIDILHQERSNINGIT